MKTKLIAVLSGVIGLGAAGAASAADMAVKARPAPVPVRVFTWTGCFIGGHVGGLWADKRWNVAPGDPSIGVAGIAVGTPFGSHTADGWLGGVQGGCDYQFAGTNWVIGIQGDYAWADATGRSNDAVNNAFFGAFQLPIGYRDETRVDALASITGRVGYAWDRFLGYVKGGYAWERDRYRIIDPFNVTVATAGETRGGWTVGVGGEYAFTNNVSAFLEYNYYDFGTQRNTFRTVVGGNVFDVADIRETKSVVKAGINFRWGPGGAVVAKY